MPVQQIMSSPVVSLQGDATLEDAVGTMLEHRVGSVLVIETGLWGIITRSDVLRALYGGNETLAAIHANDVVTIGPTDSIESALRTIEEHKIKKLPVIEDFAVSGIITHGTTR